MDGVRIDKWLWAARFFKTRALASQACELGRIHSNSQQVKASREVRPGDSLRVKNESGEYYVEVLAVSEMRGPAATAQSLFRESEESREARRKLADDRKAMAAITGLPDSKPSKRDRRELDRFRRRW
jgi:ribosome-associated heat shock protein Hsp15